MQEGMESIHRIRDGIPEGNLPVGEPGVIGKGVIGKATLKVYEPFKRQFNPICHLRHY
jgi:hypothetical protein